MPASTARPAIVVSNHGGRQLDRVAATIDVLRRSSTPSTAASRCWSTAASGAATDVVTALALGARAVLVGRAPLWGLAVGGEAGARMVLELLRGDPPRAPARRLHLAADVPRDRVQPRTAQLP